MWKFAVLSLLCLSGYCLAGPVGLKRNMPIVQQRVDAAVEETETEPVANVDPNEMMIMSSLTLPSNATSIRADITDGFSCENKTYGYYADVDNDCQIFHVCLPVTYADGKENTFRWSFICPEETIFSQDSFTCMRPDDMTITCEESYQYYELNRNFGMVDNPADKETINNEVASETAESNETILEAEIEPQAKPVIFQAEEEKYEVKPVGQTKPLKPIRRKPSIAYATQKKPVSSYPLRKMPQAQPAQPEVSEITDNQESLDNTENAQPVVEEEIKPAVQKFSRRPVPVMSNSFKDKIQNTMNTRTELFNQNRKRPSMFNKRPVQAQEQEQKKEEEVKIETEVGQQNFSPVAAEVSNANTQTQMADSEIEASETNHVFVKPVAEPEKTEEPVKVLEAFEEIPAVISEVVETPNAEDEKEIKNEVVMPVVTVEENENAEKSETAEEQQNAEETQTADEVQTVAEEIQTPDEIKPAAENVETAQDTEASEENSEVQQTLRTSAEVLHAAQESHVAEEDLEGEQQQVAEETQTAEESHASEEEETQNVEQPEAVAEKEVQAAEEPEVVSQEAQTAEEPEAAEQEIQAAEEPEAVAQQNQAAEGPEVIAEETQAAEETESVAEENQVAEEPQVIAEQTQAVEQPEQTEVVEESEAVAEESNTAEEPEDVEQTQAVAEESQAAEEPETVAEETQAAEELEAVEKTQAVEEAVAEESQAAEETQAAEEPEVDEQNQVVEEVAAEETQTAEKPDAVAEATQIAEEPEAVAEESQNAEDIPVVEETIDESAKETQNAEEDQTVEEVRKTEDAQENEQTSIKQSHEEPQPDEVVASVENIQSAEETEVMGEAKPVDEETVAASETEEEPVADATGSVKSDNVVEPAIFEENSEEGANAVQTIEEMESEKPAGAPESMQVTEEMSHPNAMVQEMYQDMDANRQSIGGFKPVDPVMAHEAEQLIADFINILRKNDFTNQTPGMHLVAKPEQSQEHVAEVNQETEVNQEEAEKVKEQEQTPEAEEVKEDAEPEIIEAQADSVENNAEEVEEEPKQEAEVVAEENNEVTALKSLETQSAENNEETQKSEEQEVPQEIYQIPVQVITTPLEQVPVEQEQSQEAEVEPVTNTEEQVAEEVPAMVMGGYKPLSIDDIVELVKERLDHMPKNEMETPMQLEQVIGEAQEDKHDEKKVEEEQTSAQEDEPEASQSEEEIVMPIYQRMVQPVKVDAGVQTEDQEQSETNIAADDDVDDVKEKTNRSLRSRSLLLKKLDPRKRRFLFKADLS